MGARPGVSQGTECKARGGYRQPRVTRYTRWETNLLIQDQVCVPEMVSMPGEEGGPWGFVAHPTAHHHDTETLEYNIRSLSVFEARSRAACVNLKISA